MKGKLNPGYCKVAMIKMMRLCRGGAWHGFTVPQLSFCPFLVIAACTTVGAGQTADCYASGYKHNYYVFQLHCQAHTLCLNVFPYDHLFSPNVQPITTGYCGERCVQWHAGGQQTASPSTTGPDPECTFTPIPPGSAAAGGPAATPALLGEALQGIHVQTIHRI